MNSPFSLLFPRNNKLTAIAPGATPPPAPAGEPCQDNLERELLALLAFGAPRLHWLSDAWYCAVEMHVTTAGTAFKVQSDFKQTTPIAAVRQCRERIEAVLSKT